MMTTAKTVSFETVRKRLLKKPGVRTAYDAKADEFSLADALIRARTKAKLTQTELATRMGSTQPQVAKLESGKIKPTLRTLERVAQATGTKLRFAFEAA
jgi:ribosome-binding protein aMBF1 (putative translation factor)